VTNGCINFIVQLYCIVSTLDIIVRVGKKTSSHAQMKK